MPWSQSSSARSARRTEPGSASTLGPLRPGRLDPAVPIEETVGAIAELVKAGYVRAIAWVLAKGPSIVPLIGARTRQQLEESLGALDVAMSPDDVARLEAAIPTTAVAGTRYDEHQMRVLDSER